MSFVAYKKGNGHQVKWKDHVINVVPVYFKTAGSYLSALNSTPELKADFREFHPYWNAELNDIVIPEGAEPEVVEVAPTHGGVEITAKEESSGIMHRLFAR